MESGVFSLGDVGFLPKSARLGKAAENDGQYLKIPLAILLRLC